MVVREKEGSRYKAVIERFGAVLGVSDHQMSCKLWFNVRKADKRNPIITGVREKA